MRQNKVYKYRISSSLNTHAFEMISNKFSEMIVNYKIKISEILLKKPNRKKKLKIDKSEIRIKEKSKNVAVEKRWK